MPQVFQATAQGIAKLLAYGNQIMGAIAAGGTVADIWAAVKAGVAEGGSSIEGATIFDMNTVVSRTKAVLGAQEAADAGDPAMNVTSEMWAWAPWADQSTGSWLTPQYQLRYQYEVTADTGETTEVWGQTDWQGSIDVPLQDIYDRVTASAQSALDTGSPGALAQMYGEGAGTVTGITALQVLRI